MTDDIQIIRKFIDNTFADKIAEKTVAYDALDRVRALLGNMESMQQTNQALLKRLEQQAATIGKLRGALKYCLDEHGGFTIEGECERQAREALAEPTAKS